MTGTNGLEGQIIADLRRTYDQLKRNAGAPNLDGSPNTKAWSMRLTLEEVETLLAMADECIELRRQTVGDWEPDFPPVQVTPSVIVPGPGVYAIDVDGAIPLTPEPGSVLDVAARTGVNIGREGCPRRGTIHSCPVGGCPDDAPRETAIPDLPTEEDDLCGSVNPDGSRRTCRRPSGHVGRHQRYGHSWDNRADLGREERETPPDEPCACSYHLASTCAASSCTFKPGDTKP